jgi:hypothetical protein
MLETDCTNVRIVVKRSKPCWMSGGDQTYIEDCQVCCRPITFVLQTDGQEWMLDVHGENE